MKPKQLFPGLKQNEKGEYYHEDSEGIHHPTKEPVFITVHGKFFPEKDQPRIELHIVPPTLADQSQVFSCNAPYVSKSGGIPDGEVRNGI